MDYLEIMGVTVKVKRTGGRAFSYRFSRVDHAVILNAPKYRSAKSICEESVKLVKKGLEEGKFNEIKDGGKIRFFGEDIPLRIIIGSKTGLFSGEIYVGTDEDTNLKRVVYKIKAFYKKTLFEYLKKRVPQMENYVGIKCGSVSVSDMVSAWGKCYFGKGNKISFSTALATQSPECIDIVIIHELGHILYHDHGKEFHAFMEKYAPNYRILSKKMNSDK